MRTDLALPTSQPLKRIKSTPHLHRGQMREAQHTTFPGGRQGGTSPFPPPPPPEAMAAGIRRAGNRDGNAALPAIWMNIACLLPLCELSLYLPHPQKAGGGGGTEHPTPHGDLHTHLALHRPQQLFCMASLSACLHHTHMPGCLFPGILPAHTCGWAGICMRGKTTPPTYKNCITLSHITLQHICIILPLHTCVHCATLCYCPFLPTAKTLS